MLVFTNSSTPYIMLKYALDQLLFLFFIFAASVNNGFYLKMYVRIME